MRARYFRYLFENQEWGLIHSGCIYDREKSKSTNYMYLAGGCGELHKQNDRAGEDADVLPDCIDILVVGGYAAECLNKLIAMIRRHKITTIILPYLAPIQRLVLVEEMNKQGQAGRELIRFLQDPYLFLNNQGIKNIYFLYGNGPMLDRAPEELAFGCHFEDADRESIRLIHEMEGYSVPVVRAGYIVENEWLFYFGVYGPDVEILHGFTRDYFSHLENIHQVSDNPDEDYLGQMKKLIQEFRRKFGVFPATTVVMFGCPINASPQENDSFMSEKEFAGNEICRELMKREDGSVSSCFIRCRYLKDYDTMLRHKDKQDNEPRFGILLLGNVNLNRYSAEIINRFWKIRFRIRGIGVPGCGNSEYWNHQILGIMSDRDRMYWICSRNKSTSAGVINDIALSAVYNRLLVIGKNEGVCFTGYLIPREDTV